MKKAVIVAIDGPAGAGKGAVARAVAGRLGFIYLDTGAMYRAVALLVSRGGVDICDEGELQKTLLESHINLKTGSDGNLSVFLGVEDVTDEIRAPEISRLASDVATKKSVRDVLRGMQRRIGRAGNIVAEGRDMGTYVFPEADFKFYLDAALEERARRRHRQLLEMGIREPLGAVLDAMRARDAQDKERAQAPLHPAVNAVIIDTTSVAAADVIDKIVETVNGGVLSNG
ncbi:MAG: (d)CMP kinase [Deltaproteobacteria bacterium]